MMTMKILEMANRDAVNLETGVLFKKNCHCVKPCRCAWSKMLT